MYGTISVQKVILLLLTTVCSPYHALDQGYTPIRYAVTYCQTVQTYYGMGREPLRKQQPSAREPEPVTQKSVLSRTYYDAHLVKCARVITYLTFVSMNLCGCTKKKSHVHIPWYLNM